MVKGKALIHSENPKATVLAVLNRFTILTGWPLWPPTDNKTPQEIKEEQMFVLDFVSEKLIKDYPPSLTVEMFEKAIFDMAIQNIAYERKPAQLFFMLDEWLIENNDEIYEARRQPDENAKKLPERSESQKHQDRVELFVQLYNAHRSKEPVVGGWSDAYEMLKQISVHTPDAEINARLWKQAQDELKHIEQDNLSNGGQTERTAAKFALSDWQQWVGNNISRVVSRYEELICRHYFDQVGDDLIERVRE